MRIHVAVATLVAFAVAVPSAQAALPSPKSKTIVPGRSIGGVKIGMPAEAAVKVWGPGGSCAAAVTNTCTWQGTMKQGMARFSVLDGKVADITLEAGQRANFLPVYSGPLTKWRTSKKIAIGSTLRKVGRTYKKAKPDGAGLQLKSGKRRTFFESSLGRVASIAIDAAG